MYDDPTPFHDQPDPSWSPAEPTSLVHLCEEGRDLMSDVMGALRRVESVPPPPEPEWSSRRRCAGPTTPTTRSGCARPPTCSRRWSPVSSAAVLASGLCWAVGRVNGLLWPAGVVRDRDVKEDLAITQSSSVQGSKVRRASSAA